MMKMTTSPGGRKLKQARLNFGSPQPSPPKKPRLEKVILGNEKEANKTEPSKNSPETPIVLSDNEVEEHVEPVESKLFNPYVSLVDIALKRKLKRKDISKKKIKSENSSSEECHEECSSSSAINHENALKSLVMVDKKSNSDEVESHKEISSVDDDEKVTTVPVSKECSNDILNDAVNPKSIVNDYVEAPSSHTDEDIEMESPAQQDISKSCDENDLSDPSESESELELSKVELHDDNESKDENDESDTADINKSEPSTPKSANKKRNDLVPKTPTSARKLTPSQMKKKLESAKKQQEREKEKMIRDRKREVEKAEKAKLKQEKEDQRKKEKEEKDKAKEQEKRERELKDKMRRMEKELKESEKQKRKEAKEEERKKREEASIEEKRRKEIEKEEMENKKKKTAAAFINFFVPKEKNSKENQSMDDSKHNYLSNFTVKSDMRLAPIIRYQLNSESKSLLDKHLENQNSKRQSMYIMLLKSKQVESKSSKKTWPLEEMKNDLIIIEDDLPPVDDVKENEVIVAEHQAKTMKPKLLGFADNRRPPYWGTWSRKSLLVTGRRPFAMDKTHLDYDCDSDDEWEEEEPGESVESIAGSDDDEGENEYDVDNDFMVPHGYLSDEEVLGEDDNALSPETHKAKLKFLENEFEDEMKKPTKHKKARLIGIIWQSAIGGQPNLCPSAVWDFLSQRSILSSEPKIDIQIDENNTEIDDGEKSTVRKIRKISDEMIPVLIKLVHGNTNNRGFLANEFQAYIAKSSGVDTNAENALEEKRNSDTISKTAIAKKIKEISTWMPCPEEGPMQSRMCWFVEKEIREKYNQSDLNLPNEWSYVLMPKRRMDVPKKEKCKSPSGKQSNDVKILKESPSTKKENAFNITKFTKKMTQEEREKQFVSNPSTVLSPSQPTNPSSETSTAKPEKKRVALLLSGPRGKDLNSPNTSQNTKQSDVDNAQKITLHEKSVNIQQVKEKTDTSSTATKKKVPLLASGPRGKDLVKSSKTNLLTHFIQSASAKDKHSSETESKMDTDSDLIVLSD